MAIKDDINNLSTESDVEQKFIFRLLVTESPEGLAYSDSDILTKPNIKKLSVGKGKTMKLYFPDYVIILDGIPSVIIEAKAPGDELSEASREARLYATEINASYKSGVNPCKYIIVTDGNIISVYNWDSSAIIVSLKVSEITSVNPEYDKFQKLVSKKSISILAEKCAKRITKNSKYDKPVYMLGGNSVINQTVGHNSFGSNISLEYKYLFNPERNEERKEIALNAYVASKRKQSHISPIDKIIRATIPPSQVNARVVSDSTTPNIIFDKLKDTKLIRNEICLLIGGVGSGKSTFTDYLKIVALPESLKISTEWININLNRAPLSKDIIYNWIIDQCTKLIKVMHPEIDFDCLDTLKEIYSRELSILEKGRASLYENNSEKHTDIIYDELLRLQTDSSKTLESYINFLYCSPGKLLVIVLDNCDKRSRNDQLLMFEVATWMKNTFQCMIFLPLRDVTYDQFCNEPPLDTVIKDLVFRIEPPLLQKVIYSRLQYALREIGKNQEKFSYYVPNNARVECPRNEVGVYIKCIVTSLFQDNYFRRVITGLAGSNIRKGLEIFLDFCKSGHIEDDLIFKIRHSNGDFKIPHHVISRILLKGNRKYYYNKESHIKNLFYSNKNDSFPNPYIRIVILKWLKDRFREYGPNKTKGFHKVSELVKNLQVYGHSRNRILLEIGSLTSAGCIITEALTDTINSNDLLSIAPSGFVHLDMLWDIDYLSTISEDTLFRENQTAVKISENMTGRGKHKVQSKQASISSSLALLNYMCNYYDNYFFGIVKAADEIEFGELLEIHKLKAFVKNKSEKDSKYNTMIQYESKYPPKSQVRAQIVSIQNYGIFVEFDLHGTGLIHKSNFSNVAHDYLETCEEGDWVNAEVIAYNTAHSKFDLILTGIEQN